MKLVNNLFGDDAGVSPVIGVILMVAITVILAAVIATFVLGGNLLGEQAPTAQLDADVTSNGENITITHRGGDALQGEELTINGLDDSVDEQVDEGEYTAGDRLSVDDTEQELDVDGDTVTVVWSESGGDSSAVLAEFDTSS